MKNILNLTWLVALTFLASIPQSFSQEWDGNSKKVILITGTASGMGKAFAEKFVAEGHIVYGGDIQYEKNRKQLNARSH